MNERKKERKRKRKRAKQEEEEIACAEYKNRHVNMLQVMYLCVLWWLFKLRQVCGNDSNFMHNVGADAANGPHPLCACLFSRLHEGESRREGEKGTEGE